jgi:D-amino-acid dehydrogenase
LPVVDHLDQIGPVFAAFGHAHLGLTQAVISAKLLVDMMLNRRNEIDSSAYRINRY